MTDKYELSEEAINNAVGDLSEAFAREAGAFADVLESWRKPQVARRVVESLLNNDPKAFNALLQPGIDPPGVDPDRGRLLCYKLLLLAEKLGQPKFTRGPEVCRLRTGLSRSERLRYLVIALRFGNAQIWEDSLSAAGLGPIIPSGPFLDALKAENLVDCVPDETVLALEPYSGVFRGLKDMCGFQL